MKKVYIGDIIEVYIPHYDSKILALVVDKNKKEELLTIVPVEDTAPERGIKYGDVYLDPQQIMSVSNRQVFGVHRKVKSKDFNDIKKELQLNVGGTYGR